MKLKYFLITLLLYSCSGKKVHDKHVTSNLFAQGFHIEKYGDLSRIDVFNPWEKASGFSYSYWLVPKNMNVPDSLFSKRVIRTPAEQVVCLSTTHIGFLQKLGLEDAIAGVSGKQYVSNKKVRANIEAGKVKDVGYDQNLNYELLLKLKPDLVMAYGIGSEVASYLSKLRDLGIPVVINAEYLEETPLGRAEWLKFVAAFFNRGKDAERIFSETVHQYQQLQQKALQAKQQPVVITGIPYKDNWWVPGGRSYMANLIADAGGIYLWGKNDQRESYVLSPENVISQSATADIWINCGYSSSLKDIRDMDERFGVIKPLRDGMVFNDNKRLEPNGGNDVWETGVTNPEVVLRDLIRIFHPDLSGGESSLYYYQKLPE